LGELYAEFDRTAAALEARHDPPQPGEAPSAKAPEAAGAPTADVAAPKRA
jgi:hypothetical protein